MENDKKMTFDEFCVEFAKGDKTLIGFTVNELINMRCYLESTVQTPETLIARLDRDPQLADPDAKFVVIHLSNSFGKRWTCRTIEQLDIFLTNYKSEKKRKRDEDIDITLGWGRMTEAEYAQVPACKYFIKPELKE